MPVDDKLRMELLTAPGGAFPLREQSVGGRSLSVFDRDPRTLRDAFLATRPFGDRLAIVFGDERWTYDQLWETTVTLAHVLHEDLGVGKGDRVGIAMRNFPEFVFAFGAAQLIGAVTVPFNAWLRSAELSDQLAESGPQIVFADQERSRIIEDLGLVGGAVRTLIGVRCTEPVPGMRDFAELLASRPAQTEAPDVAVDASDPSTVLFTSGTTGRPKAVVHSHLNHSASLLNKYIRAVRIDLPEDGGPAVVQPPALSCKLVTFPFFHIAGLNTLYNSLYAGQPLILMYKWDASEATRLVEAERVNEISGPPYVIATFLTEAADTHRDLSSVRSVGMGGAPAPLHVIEQVQRIFGDAVVPRSGYGMTESTSGVVAISGADFIKHPGSVGRTLPTAELAIMDESGNHLGTDQEGEIAVRGPQVVQEYLGAGEDSFRDGWFRTGDLGRIDGDGFIYIVGRLKDIVIRGGENINCSEVEGVLGTHPDVVEAAALGAPHPTLGEELVAIVRVADGSPVDAEQLRRHAAEQLAAFKVPARIAVVHEQLPRTPSGKIIKRDLTRQLKLERLLTP